MPTLRVVSHEKGYAIRAAAKPEKEGELSIGTVDVPNDLFPLMRDATKGMRALTIYVDEFTGKPNMSAVVDAEADAEMKQLLDCMRQAGAAARTVHGSQEFVLGPEAGFEQPPAE